MLIRLLLVLCTFDLAACASTHDLDKDVSNPSGGGFSTEEIAPGFFRLYARSNNARIATARAARRTWDYRAAQLCGQNAYRDLSVTESLIRGPYVFSYRTYLYASTREGYLICNSSGLSDEEAKRLLVEKTRAENEARVRRIEARLSEYDPVECKSEAQDKSPEHYFTMGKEYWQVTKYDVAMSCFQKVQSMVSEGLAFREACFHIGMMYELGQGVERNETIAKHWYRKSGYLQD